MPIAVSAVIQPSRLLRAALLCYAALNLGAGAVLACAPPAAFACPRTLAGGCLLAAAAAWRARGRHTNSRRIDISGLGELRLTVQLDGAARGARGPPLRLAPGSTLWPSCMLLRLAGEDGAQAVLAILPDGVAGGRFRPLAVALRSIAGQDNTFQEKQNTLNLLQPANSITIGRRRLSLEDRVSDDRTRV